MNKLLISLCLYFIASSAHADACLDAMRDSIMAIDMQNYEMILQTTDAEIQRCGLTAGRPYGRLIAKKIMANAQLGRTADGLKNADICSKNYPSYPTCLYWKAVVHRDLNQRSEFERTKKIAIKSCNYFIQNRSSILAGAQNTIERIIIEGDIEVADITLQKLNALMYN